MSNTMNNSSNNTPLGNFEDKYSSKNPISKKLVSNWLSSIRDLVLIKKNEINSITDVGCAEGFVTSYINSLDIAPIMAFDLSTDAINIAKNNYKNIEFYNKNVLDIDQNENADLIVCLEVLEHVKNPLLTLEKIHSVSNKYCLFSVPNEPIWRFMNIARLKYLKNWGNTPGHINHWSKKSFINFASKRFKIIKVLSPLPWTIILCEKYEK